MEQRKEENLTGSGFIYGADYNPEQWKEAKEIWDKDMEFMKKAHINEMTIGVFSWSEFERTEGRFDFSLTDEIIEKISKNGGKVILATPSGAKPRWLAEKYPETLRVNEDGVKLHFGDRHNHCYSSEKYKEKVRIINRKLSERYGKHPAVIAWHISNEYGGECYCETCQNNFKNYLKQKYKSVEELNKAYWAAFWSHTYDSFEQIEAPLPAGDFSTTALKLDWKRFVTHQTLSFMDNEIKAIREGGSDKPVTTNMIQGYYGLDYNRFGDKLDIVSMDAYPDWHSGDDVAVACDTAFWYNYYRALKGKPFLLMESAPGLVNWRATNKLKRPGMEILSALQAVSYGSDSVQYFQWRKSRGNAEKFHGAIIGHDGTEDTRIFKEITKTGQILEKIGEATGANIDSEVAIIFDWNNMWALDETQGFQREKYYKRTCLEYYTPFWEKGISVDVIGVDKDFDKYKLIIFPMQYMVGEELIEKIENFVKRGGYVYATYMLGMVNETDLCYLGGCPAQKLKDVFGIQNEEIDSLFPNERTSISYNGKTYGGKDYSEIIHLRGAKALAWYQSEFYQDTPCFTVNSYGEGKAYYQAFRDEGEFKKAAIGSIIKELRLCGEIKENVRGVTSQTRNKGEYEYLFVQNFNDYPVENVELRHEYFSLLSGERKSSVSLPPYGVDVLKRKDWFVNDSLT